MRWGIIILLNKGIAMSEKKENEIIKVGAVDPNKRTSPIVESPKNENVTPNKERAICWFNGKQYGPGARICSGGSMLLCYGNGTWGTTGSC